MTETKTRIGTSNGWGTAVGGGVVTGRRFDRLVVEGEPWRGKDGQLLCNCLCDCGNRTVVRARLLITQKTRSCGCLRRDLRREVNAARARVTLTAFGETKLVTEWARERNLSARLILVRMDRNWPPERVLSAELGRPGAKKRRTWQTA